MSHYYYDGNITLFSAWVKAKMPLPPFEFYTSPEFEHGWQVNVILIKSSPKIPKSPDDVCFYENDTTKPYDKNTRLREFSVKHDKKYEFPKQKEEK